MTLTEQRHIHIGLFQTQYNKQVDVLLQLYAMKFWLLNCLQVIFTYRHNESVLGVRIPRPNIFLYFICILQKFAAAEDPQILAKLG